MPANDIDAAISDFLTVGFCEFLTFLKMFVHWIIITTKIFHKGQLLLPVRLSGVMRTVFFHVDMGETACVYQLITTGRDILVCQKSFGPSSFPRQGRIEIVVKETTEHDRYSVDNFSILELFPSGREKTFNARNFFFDISN